MENIIAISSITFVMGVLIGALANHFLRADTGKNRRLEQQLDKLQRKNTQYQAEVSNHFSQTATILNRLNEDFQEVQSHLTKAAGELCSESEADDFRQLPVPRNQPELVENEEGINSAPLDYAPKTESALQSTLKEGYGLKR